jgi:hypothetical protein
MRTRILLIMAVNAALPPDSAPGETIKGLAKEAPVPSPGAGAFIGLFRGRNVGKMVVEFGLSQHFS